MKIKLLLSIITISVLLFYQYNDLFSQEPEKKVESEELAEDKSSEALLAINASQFGVKYREI